MRKNGCKKDLQALPPPSFFRFILLISNHTVFFVQVGISFHWRVFQNKEVRAISASRHCIIFFFSEQALSDLDLICSLFTLSAGGRRGGLVVSALDSGASGPGSSPGRGYCALFLGKTLYSHGASLHLGV